jgi:KaiC/GvpD/RAD55 family RecA-like ATPase
MRVSSGVRGFDALVEGGFLDGRLYVISGPPGSGKTTFTAQYMTEGLRNGERCLYVTMHETREELVEYMSSYDFGFDRLAGADEFRFLNLASSSGSHALSQFANGNGDSVKNLGEKLSAFINSRNISRVVIDSTMLLRLFFADGEEGMSRFLTSLRNCEATTLLVSEMTDPTSYSDEHYLAHGVVFFHNYLETDGMTRGIQVIKMRGTDIDCDIRQLSFSDRGLRVEPEQKVQA